jgi:hypothetical protein
VMQRLKLPQAPRFSRLTTYRKIPFARCGSFSNRVSAQFDSGSLSTIRISNGRSKRCARTHSVASSRNQVVCKWRSRSWRSAGAVAAFECDVRPGCAIVGESIPERNTGSLVSGGGVIIAPPHL